MAVGKFVNDEHTMWSVNTKAYGSVKAYIADVGDQQLYYEPLAESLDVKPEQLPAYLEKRDGVKEMCTLIRVLLALHVHIAIKGFARARDARNFLSLLEQLDYRVPPDSKTEELRDDTPSSTPVQMKERASLRHRSLYTAGER